MSVFECASQEITFTYQQKGHLQSQLIFHNRSNRFLFYKFKVTRPKYYLIKPDHGFTAPLSQTKIAITLHQEGVHESQGDKFKIYYELVDSPQAEPTKGWQKQSQVMSSRFVVLVHGLPEQYKQTFNQVKTSDLKSVTQSKFDATRPSSEGNMDQKQQRVSSLRVQVEELKNYSGKTLRSSGSMKQYVIAAAIGLALGLLSALWI